MKKSTELRTAIVLESINKTLQSIASALECLTGQPKSFDTSLREVVEEMEINPRPPLYTPEELEKIRATVKPRKS